MSLGYDEKKFMELRSKLFDELEVLEKQIAELEERREELTCILDGSYTVSRFNEDPPQEPVDFREHIDNALVDFITMNPAAKRPAIDEFFESWNLSHDDVRRALERCKRRGLISPVGRSKSATWHAVKKVKK